MVIIIFSILFDKFINIIYMSGLENKETNINSVVNVIKDESEKKDLVYKLAPSIINTDQNFKPIIIQNEPNEKLESISISMSNMPLEHSEKSNYNLASTMRKVRKQRQLHRMCAQYYERMNSFINIPAIAISGAATVYSFAYPADGSDQQVFMNKIIAGSLSALNTILFSVSSFLKYQAKAESHFIASEEYDNLLTMINFELRFPNENIQEFANKVERKILEIKKSCRYFPPEHIVRNYDKVHPIVEGDDSLSI